MGVGTGLGGFSGIGSWDWGAFEGGRWSVTVEMVVVG